MNIEISQMCETEFLKKLGIKKESVIDTIQKADLSESVELDKKNTLIYCVKKIPSSEKNVSLLAIGVKLSDEQIRIDGALKLYPDLCPRIEEKRPVEILCELSNRFGRDITIGGIRSKFFFHQTIDIKPGEDTQLLHADVVKGREYLQFMWFNGVKPEKERKGFVECAIVFCLDLDSYREWIFKH